MNLKQGAISGALPVLVEAKQGVSVPASGSRHRSTGPSVAAIALVNDLPDFT